jgi:hypothetical protein
MLRPLGPLPSPRETMNLKAKFTDILNDFLVSKSIGIEVLEQDMEVDDPSYAKRCSLNIKGKVFKTYKDLLKVLDWYTN